MQRRQDNRHDRHRWLPTGFLCLFGVCLVTQMKPMSAGGWLSRDDDTIKAAVERPMRVADTLEAPEEEAPQDEVPTVVRADTAAAAADTLVTPQSVPSAPTQATEEVMADEEEMPEDEPAAQPSGKKQSAAGEEETRTKVYLLHADRGQADKVARPDVQVLIGHVKFRQDSMYMYCDSALLYENNNSFEAFDNVRMEQGDTLFIYGDYLYYDGITLIAQLRENVKMINRNTTLLTDSLNYDRLYDLGYYFEGGTLLDEENVLTSDWGEYSPATKQSVFNHDVRLVNPKFVLTSDTLRYNTFTKVANILGPSHIVSDNNTIYSERGFYNTLTDQAELLDRSILTNNPGKQMTADSLYYDRATGYGEGFDNVVITDTINKNLLTSDYCFYNELTDSAFATKRAVVVDYSQGDSLYLHGDTLQMVTFDLNTDSVFRLMKAFHKVRMYRTDVQGVCDSLVYNSKDSCVTMYDNPILWNEEQQLLGEEIKIYVNDSTIEWAHIINQALTVEMKDTVHYNQVSGREMKAYFENGEMYMVEVIGNVLMGIYPEEKDSTMIGLNRSEGSLLYIFLKDRKMERAKMIGKSNGVLYPMDQIPSDQLLLPAFGWFDYVRPLDKEDIFNWRGKRADEILKPTVDRRPRDVDRRRLLDL